MPPKIEKPKYSVVQNVAYIVRNLWRWDRPAVFWSAARIPPMVLLPLLMVWMPRVVLDGLSRHATPGEFALSVGLVAVAIAVCSVWSRYLEGRLRWVGTPNRMRYFGLLVDQVLHRNYQWMETPTAGKRLQQAMQATRGFGSHRSVEAIVPALVSLAAGALGFFLYGALLGALHPGLVAFLIVSAVLAFLAGRGSHRYVYRRRDLLTAVDRKLWHLMGTTGETEGGKDIRLFGLSSWFGALFHSLSGDRIAWAGRMERRHYLADVVHFVLVALRDGIAYAYLLTLTLSGQLSIADFVLYFGLVAGFSTWLTDMTNRLVILEEMSLEICGIRTFLEEPDDQGGSLTPPEQPGTLEFRHVRFAYEGSDEPALRDFHLKVEPGEKIALVGVNGAGKTTAVKLLCGLYRPTQGSVLCDGREIWDFRREEWFRRLTVVFQDLFELPLTIAQNIAPDADEPIDRPRVEHCLKLAGLWEHVEALPQGMETLLVPSVNEGATKLSGGQLQRLMLARALYKDAPILVLDEPTAALDPIAESELYQSYREMTAGRTAIFISHRLASTRFCDRIIFLSDGVVAESGTHEELMALGGGYAHMFRVQSHYYQQHPEGGELDEAI